MAKKEWMLRNKKVWVVSYRYSDKHGDEGTVIVGAYTTREKANEACEKSVEHYLTSFGGVDKDGKITDAISEIGNDDAEGMTLAKARKAMSVTIIDPSGGTWCDWNITETKLV